MKRWRILEVGFGIAAFVMFSCSWAWSFWFWKEMPRRTDATIGYSIPETVHGVTVYLSSSWYVMYHVMFWGGLLMGFVVALIDFYKDPFERRAND